MESIGTPLMWAGFFLFVVVATAVDLWVLQRRGAAKVSLRQALGWSALWVALALAFGAWLWWYLSGTAGPELAREKAGEFFDASVRQWPACHRYTHTQSGSQWTVGEITVDGGMLSTVAMQQDAAAPGWGCGRALARRNNVIVDVNTCSAEPGDSAVRIARQITANVDAQW